MDDLERILAGADDIEPSSGFGQAVKAAIVLDTERLALRFPWGRWAIGLVACLVLAGAGSIVLLPAVQAIRSALQPAAVSSSALAWAAVAAAGSGAVALLPTWLRRFTS